MSAAKLNYAKRQQLVDAINKSAKQVLQLLLSQPAKPPAALQLQSRLKLAANIAPEKVALGIGEQLHKFRQQIERAEVKFFEGADFSNELPDGERDLGLKLISIARDAWTRLDQNARTEVVTTVRSALQAYLTLMALN